jgi:uncharacterized protein (DUF952 family)
MSDSAALQPPNPILHPPPFIYKIVPADAWKATYDTTGKYLGSELDAKDGFIHMSDRDATARTLELYYAGQEHVVLIQLIVSELLKTNELKWDWVPSRNTYFPHLYNAETVGGIQKQHIKEIFHLKYDPETKKHILPNPLE